MCLSLSFVDSGRARVVTTSCLRRRQKKVQISEKIEQNVSMSWPGRLRSKQRVDRSQRGRERGEALLDGDTRSSIGERERVDSTRIAAAHRPLYLSAPARHHEVHHSPYPRPCGPNLPTSSLHSGTWESKRGARSSNVITTWQHEQTI